MCGDDPAVKSGKPAPDPYLITMERFKSKPEKPSNVLVFEDSVNGVRSALAAGAFAIMVPNTPSMKIPKDLLPKISAVLHSLEYFKPEDFGLPPYN